MKLINFNFRPLISRSWNEYELPQSLNAATCKACNHKLYMGHWLYSTGQILNPLTRFFEIAVESCTTCSWYPEQSYSFWHKVLGLPGHVHPTPNIYFILVNSWSTRQQKQQPMCRRPRVHETFGIETPQRGRLLRILLQLRGVPEIEMHPL